MTRNTARFIGLSVLALGVLLLCTLPGFAQDSPQPTLNRAQFFGVSPRLDEMAKMPAPMQYGFHEANPVRRIPKANFGKSVDPTEQPSQYYASEFAVGANFLGVGNGFPGYSVPDAPPDVNMAVGDTQVLQWVNTSLVVCHKDGTSCTLVLNPMLLWPSGSLCRAHNNGDPVAQFDRKADRWVLFQNVFVSPYAMCIAISTTNDANGTYFTYQFPVPAFQGSAGFPDYPKMGTWSSGGSSDGYYVAQNDFGPGGAGFRGPQICGFHRTKLLAGDSTAEQICLHLTGSEDSLLPADVDSPISPPTEQDEFFIGSVADVSNHQLSLYSMHINDWTTGSASMTGSPNTQLITVATYNGSCGGSFGGACVPSLGGAPMDSLGDRLMYRFAYWRDQPGATVAACVLCGTPAFQHWFVNGDVESSTGQMGVRWYEFRDSFTQVTAAHLAGTSPLQQQTYTGSPSDSTYRWMGSVARDNTGDILVGYSQSSSSTHPAIGLAGRKPSDTLSTLSAETFLTLNNGGSQTDTSNRWGDYTSMRIDPTDNCTFWYTAEYYMVTSSFNWSTQIASAKFPSCH